MSTALDLERRYLVQIERCVEISVGTLIEKFPAEWADAQSRGLDADAFARECFSECDFDTLADLGHEEMDFWDVTEL